MFGRHKRRHINIVFVIFRLLLSLVIFAALLAGIFSAYKHFSGLDAFNLSPKSIVNLVVQNLPKQHGLPSQISEQILGQSKSSESVPKFIFRFALLADSHSDNLNLKKALDQIKKEHGDIRFIIGLGDYTDVGTLDELKSAKSELDSIGFRYFVTPGDHDLWDSRNKSLPPTTNYSQVFGFPFQSFNFENFKFIILYNGDNYLGLDDNQKSWLKSELEKKDTPFIFVFLHEPLFHPSSDHFMGRLQENLKSQAQDLMNQLALSGVKKVFAGDTHFFSQYSEPQTNLPMVTVGAITSERNLQNPRFGVVSVFEDGSTKVEDVEVR